MICRLQLILRAAAFSLLLVATSRLCAQLGLPDASTTPNAPGSLLTDPALSPGLRFLYDLEQRFAEDTAHGGGAAFSAWFASDAVSLANGKAPVLGHEAIAARATWSAKDYQLTWTPDGGLMGPGGDMGYTWGHYSGRSRDGAGAPVVTAGRYITVWKRQTDGSWKVEMDSSNEGPALECCRLP